MELIKGHLQEELSQLLSGQKVNQYGSFVKQSGENPLWVPHTQEPRGGWGGEPTLSKLARPTGNGVNTE